ncbi:(2Fe-2S) ferredoxin domain-containing protein [Streptomyces collinus]
MSRRDRGSRRGAAAAPAPCAVTVCRGCCCGAAQVRVTGCLDACEQANVVVVQPSAAGRAAGGRPVWLGLVHDTDAVRDIAAWITAGGPGLADPPGVLDLYAFTPSRRVRQSVED